jgi:alpha-L-rhamnosidase
MGATTVWERWDSMLPDGTVNPGEMTSFNHYALGAVADWMHRTVAGLAPAAPGYREILVRPQPNAALTHASARHLTPYGDASEEWKRSDGRFRLDVRIPVGATARVHVPGAAAPEEVGHGDHRWDTSDPIAPHASAPSAITTVREVFDEPKVWSAVVAAAVEAGIAPRGEPEIARRLAPHLDAPVADLVHHLAPDAFTPENSDLRRAADTILAAHLA